MPVYGQEEMPPTPPLDHVYNAISKKDLCCRYLPTEPPQAALGARTTGEDNSRWSDTHERGLQRCFYILVCLFYGGNTETRPEVCRGGYGPPEIAQKTCERNTALAIAVCRRYWNRFCPDDVAANSTDFSQRNRQLRSDIIRPK